MSSQVTISLVPVQPCTQQQLDDLLAAIRNHPKVTPETLLLFESLAKMGYRQRYALNISRFLDCFSDHRIDNVAREGFTDFERQALAQVTDSGLTSAQLNVVHLLLGVPDRYEYLQFLNKVLSRTRLRHSTTLTD